MYNTTQTPTQEIMHMYAVYCICIILYRVTHQVVANLPLTSKKFRFGLARPGQAKTEHLF